MLHNERIILDGIREVIGSLGRFSVTEHWERVRTSNRTFDRIKENVFKKQVQQVWNKHGDELKRDAQNGQRIPHQSLQPKMKRFAFSCFLKFIYQSQTLTSESLQIQEFLQFR